MFAKYNTYRVNTEELYATKQLINNIYKPPM